MVTNTSDPGRGMVAKILEVARLQAWTLKPAIRKS